MVVQLNLALFTLVLVQLFLLVRPGRHGVVLASEVCDTASFDKVGNESKERGGCHKNKYNIHEIDLASISRGTKRFLQP